MSRLTPRTQVGDIAKRRVKPGIYHGRLAEDYDGIGQYVLVSLSLGATTAAYKSRVAAGDFGTGQKFPSGTPVTISVHHGRIEILSLGNKIKIPPPVPPTEPTAPIPPTYEESSFDTGPGGERLVALSTVQDGDGIVAVVQGEWVSDADSDAVTASWYPAYESSANEGPSYPLTKIYNPLDGTGTHRIIFFVLVDAEPATGSNPKVKVELGGNCFGGMSSAIRVEGLTSYTMKDQQLNNGSGSPGSVALNVDPDVDLVIGSLLIDSNSAPAITGFTGLTDVWNGSFGSVFHLMRGATGYGDAANPSIQWSGAETWWMAGIVIPGVAGLSGTEGSNVTGGPDRTPGVSPIPAPLDHDHDSVDEADTAGGDLDGTYPNPGVAKIDGIPVDLVTTPPTDGQAIIYDSAGSKLVPGAGGGGGGGFTGFVDASSTNTEVVTTSTSGTITTLHSRTLLALAAGTYNIEITVYTQNAQPGSLRIRTNAPSTINEIGSHNQLYYKTFSGRYVHAGGDLTIEIVHQSEGASVTYGIGTDGRFGRKMIVTRVA